MLHYGQVIIFSPRRFRIESEVTLAIGYRRVEPDRIPFVTARRPAVITIKVYGGVGGRLPGHIVHQPSHDFDLLETFLVIAGGHAKHEKHKPNPKVICDPIFCPGFQNSHQVLTYP